MINKGSTVGQHQDASDSSVTISNGLTVDQTSSSPSPKSAPVEKEWMATDKDVEAIPENNMWLVIPAMMLVMFLAALDQTIVTTALPTIASHFNASPGEYSWVGTSYLLVSTIMVPCWGRVSDIVGRKTLMIPGIGVFLIGSALCGAAQSMTWLIGARAMQGFGGGAIISLTQIIIGDIIPLHKRGSANSWVGSIWGIASVMGPLFGGLICERASWRWVFLINLPACGLAMPALYFTLNLPARKRLTWTQLSKTFDFLGLVLIMTGCACLVVGFSSASDNGWNTKQTIALLVVGFVLFTSSMANFLLTKRNSIIPPRLLKTRTTVFWLICSTLQATAFLSASFYFPVFYQGVENASPLMSGVYVLPFSLVVSIGTIIAGQLNTRYQITRPVVWVGYVITCIGYGLCIKYLVYEGGIARQIIILIITGLGVGLSLAVPLLCIQAAMPLKEMAASTSAWLLTRSLGGTLGIAVFQAFITTGLESRFPKLDGYGSDFDIPRDLDGYHRLHSLPDGPEKQAALFAFSDSLRLLWIIWTPMMGIALLLSFCTRNYALDRTAGKQPEPTPASGEDPEKDIEKGLQDRSDSSTLAAAGDGIVGDNVPILDQEGKLLSKTI